MRGESCKDMEVWRAKHRIAFILWRDTIRFKRPTPLMTWSFSLSTKYCSVFNLFEYFFPKLNQMKWQKLDRSKLID